MGPTGAFSPVFDKTREGETKTEPSSLLRLYSVQEAIHISVSIVVSLSHRIFQYEFHCFERDRNVDAIRKTKRCRSCHSLVSACFGPRCFQSLGRSICFETH